MIKRTFADIPIFDFDELDSTNKYCVDNINLIKNDFSDTSAWLKAVVSARVQTNGKGRRGREWLSGRDCAMLASFIIDPLHFGTMLDTTLLIAIINSQLLDMGVKSGIKWPNDICVVNDDGINKLAGVLTEIAGEYLVIGVGINIKNQESIDVENITSLNYFGIEITQSELIDKILSAITELDDSQFTSDVILSNYESMSFTLNIRVRVESINETLEGIVIGIAPSGALILKLDDNRIVEISEGDVIHLR